MGERQGDRGWEGELEKVSRDWNMKDLVGYVDDTFYP